MCLLSLPILYFTSPVQPRKSAELVETVKSNFKRERTLVLSCSFLFMLAVGVEVAAAGWLPTYVVGDFDATEAFAAKVGASFYASMAAGRFAGLSPLLVVIADGQCVLLVCRYLYFCEVLGEAAPFFGRVSVFHIGRHCFLRKQVYGEFRDSVDRILHYGRRDKYSVSLRYEPRSQSRNPSLGESNKHLHH